MEGCPPPDFLGIKLTPLTPSLFSNLDHLAKVGFDFFEKSSIKSIGGKKIFFKKIYGIYPGEVKTDLLMCFGS